MSVYSILGIVVFVVVFVLYCFACVCEFGCILKGLLIVLTF